MRRRIVAVWDTDGLGGLCDMLCVLMDSEPRPAMQPIITEHIDELRQICRQFGVRRLEVFGSAARHDFDPQRSDVDFLVEFEPGVEKAFFGEYFELKGAIETLLGRPVDLVTPGAIDNPYLKRSIEESREIVYAA